MKKPRPFPLFFSMMLAASGAAQVPILGFSVGAEGCAEIEVASSAANYYVLHARSSPGGAAHATALFLGKNGPLALTEPLAALPENSYSVAAHPLSAPIDTDSDGASDLDEQADLFTKSPFNSAPPVDTGLGRVFLKSRADFEAMSSLSPGGDGARELKFFIYKKDEAYPRLYFLNKKAGTHTEFAQAIGAAGDPSLMTGSVTWHPDVVAPSGAVGTYRFSFQPHNLHPFFYVEKAAELLAANMPFLKNDLCYYPFPGTSLPLYFQEKGLFDASRLCVIFDEDIYGNTEYLGLNLASGFGLLRAIGPGETPGGRDLCIFESLPNSLPRTAGTITTVPQTPLSHVNLRAIQDGLPNAFIKNAPQKPAIAQLLGKNVFFKTGKDTFEIREATQKEVDDFYESLRPSRPLVPVRDLSKTKIEPLDSIFFEESASFGAKCANVAAMRRFGFPDGTIPDGFGLPFFFYDEFMRFNGLYAQAADMMAQPVFLTDQSARLQMLASFREKIRDGAMPNWMLAELAAVQAAFAPGTPIRCRSSTNNEDLPGFSGAGLYDSYTHRPDEGHLSKTIKQVYASMWNYRAHDEREFYRIDHARAAMGVLLHPNFDGELANGVGVSKDPVYGSAGTFYLNTQIGEDLVTNPGAASVPEEILLEKSPAAGGPGFAVMQPSSLAAPGQLVFEEKHIGEMRGFLTEIHDRFKVLYKAGAADEFAMEIEYKIDAGGQLAIKQARPWADFWAKFDEPTVALDSLEIALGPNPLRELLLIKSGAAGSFSLKMFDATGRLVLSQNLFLEKNVAAEVPVGWLAGGGYFIEIVDEKSGLRSVRSVLKQ